MYIPQYNLALLEELLAAFPAQLVYFDTIASTNDYAKELAHEFTQKNSAKINSSAANNSYIILANSQSQGRGTHGRSFSSPKASGLYFTWLWPQNLASEKLKLLSLSTVNALNKCLRLWEINCQIKWVNDLVQVKAKRVFKVCGVLCESVLYPANNYLIIGVGLNLFSNPVKAAIPDAGGIFDAYADSEIDAFWQNNFREKFIVEFMQALQAEVQKSNAAILDYYQSNCLSLNHTLHFEADSAFNQPQKSFTAQGLYIDDNAKLIVETTDKTILTLDSNLYRSQIIL